MTHHPPAPTTSFGSSRPSLVGSVSWDVTVITPSSTSPRETSIRCHSGSCKPGNGLLRLCVTCWAPGQGQALSPIRGHCSSHHPLYPGPLPPMHSMFYKCPVLASLPQIPHISPLYNEIPIIRVILPISKRLLELHPHRVTITSSVRVTSSRRGSIRLFSVLFHDLQWRSAPPTPPLP